MRFKGFGKRRQVAGHLSHCCPGFPLSPTILIFLVVILHVALNIRVRGLLVVSVVAIEVRDLGQELEHVFSVVIQVGHLTVKQV